MQESEGQKRKKRIKKLKHKWLKDQKERPKKELSRKLRKNKKENVKRRKNSKDNEKHKKELRLMLV